MKRCSWVKEDNPLYIAYHDQEWGRPLHDEQALFELLCLESYQAGLSWETVLNKREAFREAFHGYSLDKVAEMTDQELESLLDNPAIIRHRAKIFATRTNAQAFQQVQAEFGSFDQYFWSFVDCKPIVNQVDSYKDVASKTLLSEKISKDLKKRGFKFVGPVMVYSFLQAAGLINDHENTCEWKGGKIMEQHPFVTLAQHSYLETNRLILRPMTLDDLEDYHAYTSDDDLLKYDYPAHKDRLESLEALVVWNLSQPIGRWGIVEKVSGRLIGNLSARLLEDKSYAELGYTLNGDYHCKGYATEVCQAVVKVLESIPSLHYIQGTVDSRNIASIRVLEKLGLTLTDKIENVSTLRGENVKKLVYRRRLR